MAKLEALCLTNVSEPIQYVAMKALEADTSNNSKIVEKRLDMLSEKAKEIGLNFISSRWSLCTFLQKSIMKVLME